MNKIIKVMATYVIGDIHGGYKALKQIMDRAPIKLDDKFIFLGDYVDGWSESADVIQYLIEFSALYECIFLKGNHDEWCREWLEFGNAKKIWLTQGGQSTFDSYIATGFNQDFSHRNFFKNLHNYYIDDENRGFVHGGFNSRKGLGHETYQSDYYWDRDLWGLALMHHGRIHFTEDGLPAHNRYSKHKEIFIGHTSTLNWKCKPHLPEFQDPNQEHKSGAIMVPMNRCNVWNLDTGGGFGGKLTIMDIDTKEYWQSDLLSDLYPLEHRR